MEGGGRDREGWSPEFLLKARDTWAQRYKRGSTQLQCEDRISAVGDCLPLPATGLLVSIHCIEGPWSRPERSRLSALLHLLMGQELKENSRVATFLGGVSILPATTMPQTQELRQQSLNCPLNTVSSSIAERVLQLPGSSNICHGLQEVWGNVLFGSSGGTPLLRAVVQLEHTEWIWLREETTGKQGCLVAPVHSPLLLKDPQRSASSASLYQD